MNYEQKYKDALEKAQIYRNHLIETGDDYNEIEYIFPELKETEDERISREINDFLMDFYNGEYERPNENTIVSWLSWIEKKGKNKSAWSEEDEKIIETMCKEGYLTPSEMRWLKSLKYRVQPQPNQGELKHFDYENANIPQKDFAPKIEPKFKVGDWVVFKNRHQSIYQVEKIEDGYYILRHTNGGTFRVCILHDEDLRYWDINDAINGDILKGVGECYILFKELKDCHLISHCDFSKSNFHFWEEEDWSVSVFKPTTQNQRIDFCQKMSKAGYEWDAENEQLIKK